MCNWLAPVCQVKAFRYTRRYHRELVADCLTTVCLVKAQHFARRYHRLSVLDWATAVCLGKAQHYARRCHQQLVPDWLVPVILDSNSNTYSNQTHWQYLWLESGIMLEGITDCQCPTGRLQYVWLESGIMLEGQAASAAVNQSVSIWTQRGQLTNKPSTRHIQTNKSPTQAYNQTQ